MSIVAHSPPHRGEIAELFIREAATFLLRSARPCYALYALTTTSLRTRRFCGDCASATLLLQSWRSALLQALFKCPPKVGVFWILG